MCTSPTQLCWPTGLCQFLPLSVNSTAFFRQFPVSNITVTCVVNSDENFTCDLMPRWHFDDDSFHTGRTAIGVVCGMLFSLHIASPSYPQRVYNPELLFPMSMAPGHSGISGICLRRSHQTTFVFSFESIGAYICS